MALEFTYYTPVPVPDWAVHITEDNLREARDFLAKAYSMIEFTVEDATIVWEVTPFREQARRFVARQGDWVREGHAGWPYVTVDNAPLPRMQLLPSANSHYVLEEPKLSTTYAVKESE